MTWQEKLAYQLLVEVAKGKESEVWGYISLVTMGLYGNVEVVSLGGGGKGGEGVKGILENIKDKQVPEWQAKVRLTG